jgi:hypothetical protein
VLGNFLGCNIDPDNFVRWIPQRMPISDPRAIFGFISPLAAANFGLSALLGPLF